MRAIRLTAAALALLAAPACLIAAQAQTPPVATPQVAPAADANPVVARVGDEEVHLNDLSTAAQDLPQQLRGMPPAMLYPMLLNQAIDSKALLLLARKEKLDQDKAVQAQIQHAADQALQTALLTREIGPDVTEAAIKARYEKDIAGKPGEEEVHARHILVATEAEARTVIDELAKGGDFATLAKKYSTDPGGASGGDLGFFKQGDMVPEFAAAAFALKPGEVSKQPVKSQFGWHVIQVLERRAAKPATYEESHDALRQKMIRESMARLLEKGHAGLKIEKFNPDGSVPSPADTAVPPPATGTKP
jgi:peptidyl-prolyl cis-trans isomerase C